MQLKINLVLFFFIGSIVAIPLPFNDAAAYPEVREIEDLETRTFQEASTIGERAPVHWMNIERHSLHEEYDMREVRRELDSREPLHWMNIQRHDLEDYHHTGGNKQNIMGHFKWGRREIAEYILTRELVDALRTRYYESLESRSYPDWEEFSEREEVNDVQRREPTRHLHIGVEVQDYHL